MAHPANVLRTIREMASIGSASTASATSCAAFMDIFRVAGGLDANTRDDADSPLFLNRETTDVFHSSCSQ